MEERPRVQVRVSDRLLLPRGGALDAALRPRFEHLSRPTRPGAQPERVRTWRVDEGMLSLPRGGAGRVREEAARLGLHLAWRDERSEGRDDLRAQVPRRHLLELRGYQLECVRAAVERENCLVRAPTGSGKTTILLALIAWLGLPALVVVWTENLLRQWLHRCEVELGQGPGQVGVVQGSRIDLRGVTVAMQQTLAAKPEWVREHAQDFGLVAFDEVQRAAAPTVYSAADPWRSRYRVGASADETRKDRLEGVIYDVFGGVAADVSQERLIAEGAVLRVEIRVVPTDFRADWFVRARRGGSLYGKHYAKLEAEMCADQGRRDLALSLAEREARAGESVLVFSPRVDLAHELDARLARAGVMSGLLLGSKKYAKRFEETRAGIEAGTLQAGVGTIEAVGTGTDMPSVSRGVMLVPSHNNRQQLNQAKGRLCRPGTEDAALYYLWDRHVYGKAALQNLARWFGDDVVVVQGGEAVPARQYLRSMRDSTGEGDEAALEGIFEQR